MILPPELEHCGLYMKEISSFICGGFTAKKAIIFAFCVLDTGLYLSITKIYWASRVTVLEYFAVELWPRTYFNIFIPFNVRNITGYRETVVQHFGLD